MKKSYIFKPKFLWKNESIPDLNQELLAALDHLFLSIIRLDLTTGRAWLLQSAGQPVQQGYEFDWTEYLEFYSNILIPDDKEKLTDNFSLSRLLEFWDKGEEHYILDLSCQDEVRSPLIQVNALFQRWGDQPFAYILTSRNGDNSILQKIIDLYVYNNCDYFIYLDAKNNSYTMFSGSDSIITISNALPRLTQKAAILFLDMDDFKKINDTFGHDMGDQVLIAVAEVLKKNIRSTDFAGRIGGDEFVIFLNDIPNIKTAQECAQRIGHQISLLYFGENNSNISCSIGIAIAPDNGNDYTTLIKKADQKVYFAKSDGKNRFVF